MKINIFFPLLTMWLVTISPSALGLPNMTSSELLKWGNSNPLISPLSRHQNSDLDASLAYTSTERNIAGGQISLTVFLNSFNIVIEESLDYRPSCYLNYYSNSVCQGNIRFEQSDKGGSKSLIKSIWGQQILDDFLRSKLIESSKSNIEGTMRWYQGKLYNYETWHYKNYTISHFSVVSKNVPQSERIQYYKYCAINDCGP